MAEPAGTRPGSSYFNHGAFVNPTPVSTPPNDLSLTNGWASGFGQPQGSAPYATKPGDGVNRSVYIFPEAKRGEDEVLSNTMLLAIRSMNTAITSVFLPMTTPAPGSALTKSWSTWEFPTQMPDVVPHRGVVRLLKSNRIRGSSSMVRRGIGIFMEHDYMNTPEGRQHYLMHLRQINQSVAEGLQFQGIYAMLTADDWGKKKYAMDASLSIDARMKQVLQRELDRWAILQQNENSWAFLDNIINKENDAYNPGTRLTHYLVDSAVPMYMTTMPTEQWQYWLKGPAGPSLIRQGVEGFATDERGNIITETRAFLADEDGSITPLAQKTMVGEVVIGFDLYKGEGNYDGYTSRDRAMDVYSDDDDRFVKVSLRQQLDNCMRFDSSGALLGFRDREAIKYSLSRFSDAQKGADFLHHRNTNGQLDVVDFFGQINEHHLNVEDYRDAGRSAVNALRKHTGIEKETLADLLREARSMFAVASNYSNAVKLQEWIDAITVDAGKTSATTIEHPVFGKILLPETNQFGSFDLAAGVVGLKSMSYPVTHMTWGGLQTVASDPNTIAVFGKRAQNVSEKLVSRIKQVVPLLKAMYPNSIFLDPAYVGIIAPNATEYDAFFQSVVMAGIVTTSGLVPAEKNAVGAGAGGSSTASSTIRQLEDLVIGGTARYVDSIVGNTQAGGDAETGGIVLIGANPATVTAGKKLQYVNIKSAQGLDLATGNIVRGNFGTIATAAGAATGTAVPVGAGPYGNLVRWSQSVRSSAAEVKAAGSTAQGLETLVVGLVGREILLNAIAFTKTTGSAATTLDRFDAVIKAVADATGTTASLYNSGAEYTEVPAGAVFKDRATLQRVVNEISAVFEANKSWVQDRIGSVGMLKQLLTKIVRDAIDDKKTLVRQSLSLAPSAASVGAAGVVKSLAEFEAAVTDRSVQYLAAPITWTNGTIRAFVEGVADGSIALNDLRGLPASEADPRVVMPLSEFREYSEIAKQQIRENAAGGDASAVGLIGSGIDSIHIPSGYANVLQSDIAHNAALRSVVVAQRNAPTRVSTTIKPTLTSGPVGARYNLGSSAGGHASSFNQRGAVNESGLPAVGSRRKRRTVLQDSLYGSKTSNMDDTRDARKRARIEQSLSIQSRAIGSRLAQKVTPNMRSLYAKLMSRGADDIVSLLGILFLGTPVTKQALEATIEYDLMHPFNYVLARPHARYTGLKIIKAKPGPELGYTQVAFPKVEVADDGTTGVFHMNFTYYADVAIVNPKNLNITDNALIDDYHGGLGCGFYKRQYPDGQEAYNPMNDNYGDEHDSFFVFAIPRQEEVTANPMSIMGTYDWIDHTGQVVRDGSSDALTYSTAAYYCGYWGFHTMTFGQSMNLNTSSRKYTMDYCAPNNLCFKSTALYYRGGKPAMYTTQTGHWQQQSVGSNLHRARIGKKPMNNSAYRTNLSGLRQI